MLEPYLATIDPLLQQAWVDCLQWSLSDPHILAAFQESTGCQWTPGTTPLACMIDASTGVDIAVFQQYVAWFHANVWDDGAHSP